MPIISCAWLSGNILTEISGRFREEEIWKGPVVHAVLGGSVCRIFLRKCCKQHEFQEVGMLVFWTDTDNSWGVFRHFKLSVCVISCVCVNNSRIDKNVTWRFHAHLRHSRLLILIKKCPREILDLLMQTAWYPVLLVEGYCLARIHPVRISPPAWWC
jgi:hypothetical protein